MASELASAIHKKKCGRCTHDLPLHLFKTRVVNGEKKPYASCTDCLVNKAAYDKTTERKASQKRYKTSNKGKATQKRAYKRYNSSEKGKANQKRAKMSEKGRASRKRHNTSEKGKARNRRYNASVKRKTQGELGEGRHADRRALPRGRPGPLSGVVEGCAADVGAKGGVLRQV